MTKMTDRDRYDMLLRRHRQALQDGKVEQAHRLSYLIEEVKNQNGGMPPEKGTQ